MHGKQGTGASAGATDTPDATYVALFVLHRPQLGRLVNVGALHVFNQLVSRVLIIHARLRLVRLFVGLRLTKCRETAKQRV